MVHTSSLLAHAKMLCKSEKKMRPFSGNTSSPGLDSRGHLHTDRKEYALLKVEVALSSISEKYTAYLPTQSSAPDVHIYQ